MIKLFIFFSILLCGENCFGQITDNNVITSSTESMAIDHYKKAQECWNNKDFMGALGNIDMSINFSPNRAGGYYFRGFVYCFGFKNYELAINDFSKAIQFEPNSYQSYFYRGIAFFQLDKYTEAIMDMSKVILNNQENTDAYFIRARSKQFLGEFQDAIYDYNQIVKMAKIAKPNYYTLSQVYFDIAYNLDILRRPKEALNHVDLALKIDNANANYFRFRGELHYKLGDFKECIKDMSSALSINNKMSDAYYLRGLSAFQLKKNVDGCADLQRARQLGETKALAAITQYCQ
jgi:tetratricopeptide (TPR) repeat protein